MASHSGRSLNRLFVANIPWTVSHRELAEYFAQFGQLQSARVIFDKSSGLSRGYGFVEYTGKNGFDNATNRQIHTLEGNNLNVNPSS